MTSKALKKALQGDEYFLVLMTELIGNKQVSKEDEHFITSSKSLNQNKDYLLACIKVWEDDSNEDTNEYKYLAAKGNTFASNLLSAIHSEVDTKKEKTYPLGIINNCFFDSCLNIFNLKGFITSN